VAQIKANKNPRAIIKLNPIKIKMTSMLLAVGQIFYFKVFVKMILVIILYPFIKKTIKIFP
jgi:hypothetical protein